MSTQNAPFVPDPSWPSIVELATELWGPRNKAQSTNDDVRFGANGSKSVRPGTNQWYDHEAGEGGGYTDLYRLARGGLPRRSNGKTDGSYRAEFDPHSDIAAVYDYADAASVLLFQVVREVPKNFLQRRPDGSGGWIWDMRGIERVPYRLPDLMRAAPHASVYVCEGEKDCDALHEHGLVATTNPGGAGKWLASMSVYVSDRNVIILPDNDDAGEAHAQDVAAKLHGIANSVRTVRLPGLPVKGDISDWLAAGGTAEELERLAEAALANSASADDASGKAAEQPDEPAKPLIRVSPGKIDKLADDAESALLGADAEVFQRAEQLVRPGYHEVSASDDRTTIVAGLHVLKQPALIEELTRVAEWQAFDGRSKKWKTVDPPGSVAAVLGSRVGRWRLRSVSAITTCPTMRPDGTILSAPGYDLATRIYHMPHPNLCMPSMPDHPTKDDAKGAVTLLNDLLAEFPFVDETDTSVALSLIVSAVVRGALGMVPVHAFTAPTPGTGKSFLGDVAAAIVFGRGCPVITPGRTEEELEKRLGAMLLAGYPLIALDNITNGLGGDALCQIAERPIVRIRILGKSETPECEFRGIIIANGNNIVVIGDMTRRVILGKLDAKMEQPEKRQFKFDPVKSVLADRGRYIVAAMTIVRAYLEAGQPEKLAPLLSYAAWSDMVRSALVWLGCGDPVATMTEIRDADPVLTTLRTVLDCWRAAFGGEAMTAAEVAAEFARGFDPTTKQGEALTALRAALVPVAAVRNVIDTQRLGNWLRTAKARPVNGFRFAGIPGHGGVLRWSVVAA